jgi:DNA-binding NtrC family response regulator
VSGTVLVVDDQKEFAVFLTRLLARQGYQVAAAHSAAEAREKMDALFPDVVLMDLKLPDADGSALTAALKRKFSDTQFIIVTGHGSIRSAVECTRRGAVDYLTKPCEPEEVLFAVESAIRKRDLDEEVKKLRARRSSQAKEPATAQRQYASAAMRQVMSLAKKAAKQSGLVLLLGESGSGKDFLAQWIHNESERRDGPFFTINCAALSRELAESELFGHEPGAFTGTRGRKRGLVELAQGGTLLLNEIGELDLSLQSKLLTFLDTRSFLRVGGEQHVTIEARIFAATNRDLAQMVREGRFREDLFYRLNVLPIRVPPLRERREDVASIADEVLDRLTDDMGHNTRATLSPDAREALVRYAWPGNVRELRNVLERALMLADGDQIEPCDLPFTQDADAEPCADDTWRHVIYFRAGEASLHDATHELARALVLDALRKGRTKQRAARLLGLTRHALAHQIKTLGIADDTPEDTSEVDLTPFVHKATRAHG